MPLKTKKRHWKPSNTFALFSILGGVGGMGAAKLILDVVKPNSSDNLPLSLIAGISTGILIGSLTSSGVLTVRTFQGQKRHK